MGLFGRLLRLFILFKLIQLVLIYFTPCQFDTSSEIIINNLPPSPYGKIITTILNKLIVWDSVYFNDLFTNPIKFEHQFVFCPGWIYIVKFFGNNDNNYYTFQLASILISNIFHFVSIIVLYYLTNEINSELSYHSSLLMIISPAGVFLTTNYSENFSNLLALLAFLTYFKSINFNDVNQPSNKSIKNLPLYIISGMLCAYSFTVRANGLFLGVIYLLDLYHFIKNKNPEQIIWSIISGSLLFFTFLGTNIYHYVTFCPGRGEWCDRLLPSMFQYAQEHYWNVGFLKYWTLNNIPNFILVGPVLIFNVYSVMFMYKELPRHWKLGPLILINTLTVIGGVFFWNTQILNRVTSFSPLLYWTLAANLLETKRWARYAVVYCVMWSFVQTVLFAGFLPPA